MTLPSSGVLAASAVNTELQVSSSTPFQMSDALVRYLAKKQTAGSPISMADLRGKSFTASLSDINPPVGSDNINVSQGSVGISANGNTMVVVGTSSRTLSGSELVSGGGAAMVYERNSSGVFQLVSTFLFRSYAAFNEPGMVSITDDGTRVCVAGALGPGFTHPSSGPTNWFYNGGVATFYKSSGTWVRGADVYTDYVYWSGYPGPVTSPTRHVTLSADGSTMVASADERGDPAGSGNVGAVYVFAYAGSGTWTRTQKIKPSGTTSNPYYRAQLSADGNTLLVCGSTAWLYKNSGGSFSFFLSYSASITGVVAADPDINGASSSFIGYPVLFMSGAGMAVPFTAVKGGIKRKRVIVCSIGASSVSQDSMFMPVPSSFGIGPFSTEYMPNFCVSADATRMCFALYTANSSFETTGTYLLFWFKHPTTGAWVYQGHVGTAYPSPPGNMYYYIPVLNSDGNVGACSTVQFSTNLVIQITS